MSLYISKRWFRNVMRNTCHHVALVDQPPRSEDPTHHIFYLNFDWDLDVPISASLLYSLLEGFKHRWVTPPFALTRRSRAPKRFIEEQLLNAVWKLVEIIDYLHDAGVVWIHPTTENWPIEPTVLETLKVAWMRDPRGCASSTRNSLALIWTFVAGERFPDPPPAFNLPGAITAGNDRRRFVANEGSGGRFDITSLIDNNDRGRGVATEGSGGRFDMASLIDNTAAVAIGLHNVVHDPFFAHKPAPGSTQPVPGFCDYRSNDLNVELDMGRQPDWLSLRYLTLYPFNRTSYGTSSRHGRG